MFIMIFMIILLCIIFIGLLLIARKTGAWISIILGLVIDQIIVKKLMGIHMTKQNYPEIYPIYEKYLLIVMAIPIIIVCSIKIYKFIKRTIRKFKGEVDVIEQS